MPLSRMSGADDDLIQTSWSPLPVVATETDRREGGAVVGAPRANRTTLTRARTREPLRGAPRSRAFGISVRLAFGRHLIAVLSWFEIFFGRSPVLAVSDQSPADATQFDAGAGHFDEAPDEQVGPAGEAPRLVHLASSDQHFVAGAARALHLDP